MRPNDPIDLLIEEVTVDAYGDEEQVDSFMSAISEELPLPVGATVSGEPAVLLDIDAEGWPRSPLVTYRSAGRTGRASVLDVRVAGDSVLANLLAAYRRWANVNEATGGRPVDRRRRYVMARTVWRRGRQHG